MVVKFVETQRRTGRHTAKPGMPERIAPKHAAILTARATDKLSEEQLLLYVAVLTRVDSSVLLPNAARCLMEMLPVAMKGHEWQIEEATEGGTRRELIEAVAARYRAADRDEKKGILDEFVRVTGFHRKHSSRVLKKSPRLATGEPRHRARVYNEAVREALTIVGRRPIGFVGNGCVR